MKKILIAVPCMDEVKTPFCTSLAMLKTPADCETTIYTLQGSLIYQSRNDLAAFAVRNGFDFIAWFDSDMAFPPDTLERMLLHHKDGRKFVSGLYFRRVAPYHPVLFKTCNVDTGKWTDYNDYPKDSTFEVEGVGFGCVFMDTQILFDIAAAEGAGFFTPKNGFGEDLAFCNRARKQGYKIWVDSSIKCTHFGTIGVTEELYEAVKGVNNDKS